MLPFHCLYPTAAVETAMISFTCLPEAVSMVMSLLAANGYGVDIPAHKEVGGTITTLLTFGSATAVLIRAAGEVVTIDIWGIAHASAAGLLETLPLALQQRPPSSLENGSSHKHPTAAASERRTRMGTRCAWGKD
jgi:hypothetical protein